MREGPSQEEGELETTQDFSFAKLKSHQPCSWKTNFLKRFYLFIFRDRGREGERGEKHLCETDIPVASHTHPNWEPGLQAGPVPWLGIELATFQFPGWSSIHWAAPAGARRRPCFNQRSSTTYLCNLVIDIFQVLASSSIKADNFNTSQRCYGDLMR